MIAQLRTAFALTGVWTLLLGVGYPASITALASFGFSEQARGSPLVLDGTVVGSSLVGQDFRDPRYFSGRPSAAGYDGRASSGSNAGPLHPDLAVHVAERVAHLQASAPARLALVPIDLVTTSASGLDPHVSPAAAMWQVERVAHARGRSPEEIRALVAHHVEARQLGVLGEPRVNVLRLNLALDDGP